MINTNDVLNNIVTLGLNDFDESANLLPICTIVCEQISRRLRDESYANNPVVIMACSAMTIYNFLLFSNSRDDYTSFKAGDITVKHNYASRVEIAEKLKLEAIVNAAPYLTDVDFVFEAVEA